MRKDLIRAQEREPIKANSEAYWQKPRQKLLARTLLMTVIWLFLMSVFVPCVSAQNEINLINQESSLELGRVQTISLSITSNASLTLSLIEIEGQNYSLEKVGTNYAYAYLPNVVGIHAYRVYATNLENETATYSGQFSVTDTTEPKITSIGPTGILNTNPIELKAITDENSTCKYDTINVSYDSMRYALPGVGTSHVDLASLSDGIYTYYMRCRDPLMNTGYASKIMFTIDTTTPQITSSSPQGITSSAMASLYLTTSEPAMCRWGQSYSLYSGLANTFQNTGGNMHAQPILLTEGTNQFFASCQDVAGNANTPVTISAELNLPPKATVFVERDESKPRLGLGTYLVRVSTNEIVKATPSLSLSCPGADTSIPLQGSGSSWQGYLVISQQNINCAAEFRITATDLKDLQGNEITDGKIVLIDTRVPKPPVGLNLANYEDKIKISWSYPDLDDAQISQFKIYRSTSGNTVQGDYKYSAAQQYYLDADIQNKIGYFYKISAVSKSGIESALSEEAFVMAEKANSTLFKQDPAVSFLINSKIQQMESLKTQIETQIATFSSAQGILASIVEEKGVMSKMGEAKSQILSIIGELKGYQLTEMSLAQIQSRTLVIDARAEQLKKSILLEIIITEEFNEEQQQDTEQAKLIAQEYLKSSQLTDFQKTQYFALLQEAQDSVRINTVAANYRAIYEGGVLDEGVLLIEKILAPAESVGGYVVQEILPRGEIKLSELEFDQEPADINSNGPIWNLKSLNELEIKYHLAAKLSLGQIKSIKTIVMPEMSSFLNQLAQPQGDAKITGNVPQDIEFGSNVNWTLYLSIALGCLLAILLVYYFLVPSSGGSAGGLGERLSGSTFFNQGLGNSSVGTTGSNGGMLVGDSGNRIGLDKASLISGLIADSRLALNMGDAQLAVKGYALAKEELKAAKIGFIARLKLTGELNALYEDIVASSF